MRRSYLVILLAIEASISNALASSEWPNEPQGSVTLLDCGFDSATCGSALSDSYSSAGQSLNVVSDGSAPLSGSNVVQSKLTYPNRTGGTQLDFMAPHDIRNVYVAFWWKPSTPFGGNIPGGNKTFFVRSGNNNSNGVFYWVYRYSDTPESNGNLGDYFFDTQIEGTNVGVCGQWGRQCWPNTGNNVKIWPGNWYRIEVRFVGGSCPTCADGSHKLWITPPGGSPVLVADYPNFQYSTTFKNAFTWSETWDGYGNGTVPAGYTSDQSHSLDHLYISSTDCNDAACMGPGDGTPPSDDTNPPSAPTGLAAAVTSATQVHLTWNAATDNVGVTGYRIYRDGVQVGTSAGTSYDATGLTASTTYSFTVAAYDAANNSSTQSSPAGATTLGAAGVVGTVSNLVVASSDATTVTLSFTEVDNGQGLPASYDIRVQSPTISWGAAASVASGTCTSPVAGTTIGNVKTCVVSGLQAETSYEFQLIPFRGVMNQGATYGSLSNVASGQTLAANSNPPPDSNPPPSDPPPANNPGDVNGDGTANVNCHDENGQRVCDVDAKGTVNGCSATHAMPVWFAAAMSLALRRRKATS